MENLLVPEIALARNVEAFSNRMRLFQVLFLVKVRLLKKKPDSHHRVLDWQTGEKPLGGIRREACR